jgi:tetratricopeptide (TPR) repeat protein
MSNDEKFLEIRTLINEREQNAENLIRAENELSELLQFENFAWAYGLFAEIHYLKAEVSDKSEKANLYEKGIEFGKKGIALDPKNIESQFWTGVCYGLLGDERGILNSFFLLSPLESCIEASVSIQESYFFGGPLRVKGVFYNRLPSWPISKGDNKKALDCLLKALAYGEEFFLNHLYIGQVYKSMGNRVKAREHFEWILNAPVNEKYKIENARHIEKAKLELS